MPTPVNRPRVDGTPELAWWVRHRVFLYALLTAGMLTVTNGITAAYAEGWDLAATLQFFAVGFPVLFLGLLLTGTLLIALGARHRAVRPVFPVRASRTGALAVFAWSGRRLRQAALQLVAFSFFVAMTTYLVLSLPLSLEVGFTVGLFAILAVMFWASFAAALGERSFLIDVTGVHARRPLHQPIDVSWLELAQVGIVPATPTEVMSPRSRMGFSRILALRDRQGRMRGTISPFIDLAPNGDAGFEAALRSHAAAHDIAVVNLTYREFRGWVRQGKARASRLAAT